AVNMADTARKRGIRIDLHALEAALGVPVVETVAVKRGGARALVEQLDADVVPRPATTVAGDDLHAEGRRLLARAVHMPERTARTDEALDRVLLHPLVGPLVLAATMFLIFQAVFAWAAPLQDALSGAVAALGAWSAGLLPDGP